MKFLINTDINFTVKINNGSHSRWRNHLLHRYAPPPNFTVFLTHWGDKRSSFLRLTNHLPSDPNKLNLDSSLKWTIFHCSSIHTICSVVKWRRNFWFFFEIKGLRHGIQAPNFSLFNLRETVFLEIGFLRALWLTEKQPITYRYQHICRTIILARVFQTYIPFFALWRQLCRGYSTHKRTQNSPF